jgi:GNAT superfamily N-acetyltransferase
MIDIKEYDFEKNCQDSFLDFMKELYINYNHAETYINYIKKLIDPLNPSFKFIKIKNFIAYSDKKTVGHISAIIDERLVQEDNPVGIIGFYECIGNSEISSLLINKAIEHLKKNGCRIVRAPIDLTIWHPYRFVVKQNEKDSFSLEPLTKVYYIAQFEKEGFEIKIEYGSAERTDFDTIIPYTEKDYESAIHEGFKIRELTKENFRKGILSIYPMTNEIFGDSWSFVKLSEEEYMYIYQDYEGRLNNVIIQIISDKSGKDVGFCSSILDPINKSMILKTIGVLPEYQNKRIGSALLYYQHRKAKEMGLSKEIYALIKLGNTVTKLPYPGAKIIRKYVGLERQITQ